MTDPIFSQCLSFYLIFLKKFGKVAFAFISDSLCVYLQEGRQGESLREIGHFSVSCLCQVEYQEKSKIGMKTMLHTLTWQRFLSHEG